MGAYLPLALVAYTCLIFIVAYQIENSKQNKRIIELLEEIRNKS